MSPKYYLLNINDLTEKKLIIIKRKLKKFVIKPNRSGSSFGIKIIKNQKEFDILISYLEEFKRKLNNHEEILVEEYISGRELTVSTIKLDKKIPSFVVYSFDTNNKISYDQIFKDNKYYLLNIWSSWCLPCRNEHAYLLNLKSLNKLSIICINYKDY